MKQVQQLPLHPQNRDQEPYQARAHNQKIRETNPTKTIDVNHMKNRISQPADIERTQNLAINGKNTKKATLKVTRVALKKSTPIEFKDVKK
jgi:hypothetical protein